MTTGRSITFPQTLFGVEPRARHDTHSPSPAPCGLAGVSHHWVRSEMEDRDPRDDLAIAEAKIDALRQRAKHSPRRFWTLDGMLAAWRDLADEIESGYQLTVDDYTNDLCVRNLLEEVLAVIPEGEVRSRVEREIEEADLRYKGVTHSVARQIHGGPDAPWWFFRVPNLIVGELAEDLGPDGDLHGP